MDRRTYSSGSRLPQRQRLFERHAIRHIAIQRIVRAGLIRQHIRHDAAPHQFRQHVRAIAHQPNRHRLALALAPRQESQAPRPESTPSDRSIPSSIRFSMRAGSTSMPRKQAPFMVAASGCAPPMPPMPPETTSLPAQATRRNAFAPRRERLVRALHDSLAADVDPRPRRHLPVHRQPQLAPAVELVPVRPVPHQVRIGDQNPRRIIVRPENPHRLARLHQQRLVVLQLSQATARSHETHSQFRAARPVPP